MPSAFSHSETVSQPKDSITPFGISSLWRPAPVVSRFSHKRATPSFTERHHTPDVPPSWVAPAPHHTPPSLSSTNGMTVSASRPSLLRLPESTQLSHPRPPDKSRYHEYNTPALVSPRHTVTQNNTSATHTPLALPLSLMSLTPRPEPLNSTVPQIFGEGRHYLRRGWASIDCFLEASRSILRVNTKGRR